ncbi:hypothetical protein [Halotalea alkalilenta]|uniref:hypothetical protein n=1 Tax=Halotalea alkalilenta TaxID=376489 RepID=UPI0007D08066|nr:hypothetical protein [Halotalea alkalilenta]
MIRVQRKEGFNLRITRVLREASGHSLDLYLFVPGELGLTTHLVSEDTFYHNAIHTKRTYYSTAYQLPLVHSRLAGRGRMPAERYRLSLSLYAYQYATALEQSTRDLLDGGGSDDDQRSGPGLTRIDAHLELVESILRRLRRNAPDEGRLTKYFVNIDNYLSWFTEQQMLALLSELPRDGDYPEIERRLLALCEREAGYRLEKRYNSERAMASPTRMSNKMRLLRRLIEFPVTLKDRPKELGGGEQRAVKALVTGLVMMVISILILEMRHIFGDVTFWFFIALAVLYAMREVFKEDLRNTLWRWVRKGRPKWRRRYRDPESGQVVGSQREWFDYKRPARLSEEIRNARRSSVSQREEVVLHYRSRSRMLPTRFLSGYEQTRETLMLDLGVLTKLMEPGNHHVYVLKDGEVSRQAVEKRYQFNLIARSVQGDQEAVIQRWKIVLNRSKIIDVEEVTVEERKSATAGSPEPSRHSSTDDKPGDDQQ